MDSRVGPLEPAGALGSIVAVGVAAQWVLRVGVANTASAQIHPTTVGLFCTHLFLSKLGISSPVFCL